MGDKCLPWYKASKVTRNDIKIEQFTGVPKFKIAHPQKAYNSSLPSPNIRNKMLKYEHEGKSRNNESALSNIHNSNTSKTTTTKPRDNCFVDQTDSQLFDCEMQSTKISHYPLYKTNQNVTICPQEITDHSSQSGVNLWQHCFSKSKVPNDFSAASSQVFSDKGFNGKIYRDSPMNFCHANLNTNTSVMTHNRYMVFQDTKQTYQCNENQPSIEKTKKAFNPVNLQEPHESPHQRLNNYISASGGESINVDGMCRKVGEPSWMARRKRTTSEESDIQINLDGKQSEYERTNGLKRRKTKTDACVTSFNYDEYHRCKADGESEEEREERNDKTEEWMFFPENEGTFSSKEDKDDAVSVCKTFYRHSSLHNRNRYPSLRSSSPKLPDKEIVSVLQNYLDDNKPNVTTNPIVSPAQRFSSSSNVCENSIKFQRQNVLIPLNDEGEEEQHEPISYQRKQFQTINHNISHCQQTSTKNNTSKGEHVQNYNKDNIAENSGGTAKDEVRQDKAKNLKVCSKDTLAANKNNMELTLLCVKGGDSIINPPCYEGVSTVYQPKNVILAAPSNYEGFTIPQDTPTFQQPFENVAHFYNNPVNNQFSYHNDALIQSPLGSPSSIITNAIQNQQTHTTQNDQNLLTTTTNNMIINTHQQGSPSSINTVINNQPPAQSSNPNITGTTFLLSMPNVSPQSQASSSMDSGYGGPGSVGSLPSSTYSAADSPISHTSHNNNNNGSTANAVNLAGFPNSPWQTTSSDFSIPPTPTTVGTSSSTTATQQFLDVQSVENNYYDGGKNSYSNVSSFDIPIRYDAHTNDANNHASNDVHSDEHVNTNNPGNNYNEKYSNDVTTDFSQSQCNLNVRQNIVGFKNIVSPEVPSASEMYYNNVITNINNSELLQQPSNQNVAYLLDNTNSSTTCSTVNSNSVKQHQTSNNSGIHYSQSTDNISNTAVRMDPNHPSIEDRRAYISNPYIHSTSRSSSSEEAFAREVFGDAHVSNEDVQNLQDSDIQTIVDSLYRDGLVEIDDGVELERGNSTIDPNGMISNGTAHPPENRSNHNDSQTKVTRDEGTQIELEAAHVLNKSVNSPPHAYLYADGPTSAQNQIQTNQVQIQQQYSTVSQGQMPSYLSVGNTNNRYTSNCNSNSIKPSNVCSTIEMKSDGASKKSEQYLLDLDVKDSTKVNSSTLSASPPPTPTSEDCLVG